MGLSEGALYRHYATTEDLVWRTFQGHCVALAARRPGVLQPMAFHADGRLTGSSDRRPRLPNASPPPPERR